MGDVYKMSQSRKKWIELYDGEYHTIWETPKRKNGEYDYIIAYRGMYVYFSPKEFSELADGLRDVTSGKKPNGDCYR